jgi:DNA polymerase-4
MRACTRFSNTLSDRKSVPVPDFADELQDFLDPLPVTELWPLDPKTLEQLQALGITTIGLLRCIPYARLAEHFGREARRLHDLARGLDHSPVQPLYPPREIVVRQTLPGGMDNPEALDRCLRELAGKASRELRRRQEVCNRVALRVTLHEEQQVSASLRLRDSTHAEGDLLRACRGLLKRLRLPAPVAAVALKASECRRDTGRQLNLFHDTRALSRRRQRTSQALEVIRECFGHDIAVLGTEMELPRRERVLAALG